MSTSLAAPRRALLALAAGAPFLRPAHAQPRAFRIGFQKSGPLLAAKQNRDFERALNPLGIEVSWVEFTYGPPLLEALNVGSIDFGATGDAPPIFAQAARAKILYVAATPSRGASQAILVPQDSPLQAVAELKGKRLAYARGSSAHSLAVGAVEQAGLAWRDIQPVELPPADAGAAFARGNVDAWSIWDPFYALAELQRGARVLVAGDAVEPQSSFFLASRPFTEANPRLVAQAVEILAGVGRWSAAHPADVARLASEATGLPVEATRRATNRTAFDVVPLSDAIVAQQQRVADRFHRLGLVPRAVAVRDIVWHAPAA
ncbi:aliphatic sulfonate ABC transporter substrate-binding protein [Paracraurococcus ruber]|uniref:Sulfonate ABC transporter substrate-binding protein n=1 Tax=Paracraurococcus ruber TaxID=77675 RepID=A0ABS1CZ32_9PROT|nr:aliphatic sulfonate ABC transporter substrate-binding protein [Paracraurococcus ruber]MBK1659789.1 sulfonate ABC transporter substrate-binding protein [Paracraurococcus ruber]TDG32762.1 aliphatic sulfonate ABC transporter substrate-binding protein [Paracraurococcus ruber]